MKRLDRQTSTDHSLKALGALRPDMADGKRLAVALAFLLLIAGCSGVNPERPARPGAEAVPNNAGSTIPPALPSAASWLAPRAEGGLGTQARAALTTALDEAVTETGASTITAAVWQSGGEPWIASHGTTKGHLHYWASVGKLVTAAAVLRLEAEGRLSLDDAIATYVPGVPEGDRITVRMLLNHTSGLSGEPLDLDGVLEVLRRQPPYARPGAAWRYSNSGYSLLGAMIEDVTGRPYHEAATALVLSRSTAEAIRLLAPGDGLDDIVPPAPSADANRVEVRGVQAAGGVVADAGSMTRLLRDLLSGQILPPKTVARMLEGLHPMHQDGLWYGLGLMVYEVPGAGAEALWIGHSGGVPGAQAVVAYAPAQQAIIAVALTSEGSAEATAYHLLRALESHD
ncbi:serine hydrolase domain-containing protein [Halochromatium sp.]